MATNRLTTVHTGEHRARTWVTLDLVGHQHADVVLLCHERDLLQELGKVGLTLAEFAASLIVDSEAGHDAVDNEQSILAGAEGFRAEVEKLALVLAIDGSGVGDVVVRLVWVHTEAFGNLCNSVIVRLLVYVFVELWPTSPVGMCLRYL